METLVLFVSPRAEDALRLSQMLLSLPFRFDHVLTLEQARKKLSKHLYSAVLTEAALPDGTWLDVLRLARRKSPRTEVIVTDPFADAREWAEVLNRGGYDMIAQPFHEAEVRRILSNVCTRLGPEADLYRKEPAAQASARWAG
ncbi:MAG: response regulator [Bryobacteraceae bacterium]